MTQIANTITAVKNTRVKIGTDNFELHIPSVKFSRTSPKPVTWQGGTPEAQYADATPSSDHVTVPAVSCTTCTVGAVPPPCAAAAIRDRDHRIR